MPRARTTLLTWSAIGGLVASLVIGIPMHSLGMMVDGPAELVGSNNVGVGWLVHLAAGVLFALPFAFVFVGGTTARAVITGLMYGAVIGVLFAWIALFTITRNGLFTGAGALDVGLHVLWGGILGLVTWWGVRRSAGEAGRARPLGRPA